MVSGLIAAMSNGFSCAPTRSGPPRVPKERSAAQSAKPCLSEDAAELSHVLYDVYLLETVGFAANPQPNWRGPGGFPPSPLTKISQPVSRVLYGLRQEPQT